MCKKKEIIDYISNQTRYSVSLLVSLGYRVEAGAKRKRKNQDLFKIYGEDGVLILTDKNKIHHKRKEFYRFAKDRHNSLRWRPMKRRIEFQID